MIIPKEITPDTLRLSLESIQDCQLFGNQLAPILSKKLPCVIGLVGTLGAGKTQLVKFLAQSLGANPEDVFSPTFVLIHPIGTTPEIFHVDAYRIHDSDEFLELGIEELFEQPAITIIEWADRFPECMPKNTLWIQIHTHNPQSQSRLIQIGNLLKHPKLQEQLVQVFGQPTKDNSKIQP
ncbi:MAG: tRNA (adenosine(37)-N6)-threonylcarbamoyltransferase complex ATPase subunit type 1 TsaE [Pirellula sp.]